MRILTRSLSLDCRDFTKCWKLDSFPVSQTLGPRPKNARYSSLVFFALSDPFLIRGIITSPIFVDPFPVVFTVLSLVISDMFLVLLTIGSLAAGESFLVNFIPSFTTRFEFSARYRFCSARIRSLFSA